jgi:hypothetical protein
MSSEDISFSTHHGGNINIHSKSIQSEWFGAKNAILLPGISFSGVGACYRFWKWLCDRAATPAAWRVIRACVEKEQFPARAAEQARMRTGVLNVSKERGADGRVLSVQAIRIFPAR